MERVDWVVERVDSILDRVNWIMVIVDWTVQRGGLVGGESYSAVWRVDTDKIS